MASQPPPWERYGGGAPGGQALPPIIQGPPRQPAPQTAPQAQSDVLGNQRTGQQIRQSDTRGVNFSDEHSLRSQYLALPEVRNYQSVAPILNSALRAAPGGAGDLDIVYAFAKVMDPGSVVREGEQIMVQNTGSLGEQIRGHLQAINTGGRLTDENRRRLLDTIQNRASQFRATYGQVRKQYWRDAERYGFSPEAVVGEDIDAAYEAGTNAPPTPVAAPMAPVAGDPEAPRWATGAVPRAMEQITRTDPRESAQASQLAVRGEAPTSAGEVQPNFATDQDRAYNEAWVAMLQQRPTRAQAQQWLNENYGRFYLTPNGEAPQIPDSLWAPIEESQRAGRGLPWQPPQTGRHTEEQVRDEISRQQGVADRRQYAEENPIMSRIDTAVRQGANALTLGTADQVSGLLSGRGAAYEHGMTSNDWSDRPLESFGGSMIGGSRLPYGNSLLSQVGTGAAYGGVTGFQEADGSFSDRLGNSYRGAATGAGANALLGAAGRSFRASNADDIIAAGERQDVFVPRFMVGNNPAQVATGAVGATPGRIPLARAANRVTEGLEAARDRSARQIGAAADNFEAGRRAQSGAREFLRRTKDRADQLFQRIPIRPETPAELTNTRQALGELTEGLTSNPQLSSLLEDSRLIQFRDALNQGGLSWADQRRFRSLVGEMIGQPQLAGEVASRAALRRLYSALTDDMQATAAAQGQRALTMFNRANQYYRGREARREGIITDILGSDNQRAPEDTFRLINRWAQRDTGNTGALRQAMRSLPEDDANAVRATIFSRMGRATRANQDETGEVFSPHTFASQWAQLEPRAKELLVPNAAHRRSLDDIALLASSMRRSERFTNTSNTGIGTNLGMFTLGGMASLPTAAGAGAATYTFGRLLSTRAGTRSVLRALRNPEAFAGLLQRESEEDQ